MLRVVIILPTYNERENIGNMIDALQAQFGTLPHDMQILVVDDSSPDGTAEVVRMKQASMFQRASSDGAEERTREPPTSAA